MRRIGTELQQRHSTQHNMFRQELTLLTPECSAGNAVRCYTQTNKQTKKKTNRGHAHGLAGVTTDIQQGRWVKKEMNNGLVAVGGSNLN
jgi:hypothetical protein